MILNVKRQSVKITCILLMASLVAIMTGCTSSTASPLTPQTRLRLATTTSLYDTGLWGHVEPIFEEKYYVQLDIVYAGTGRALEYGRRGDVDIIAVHSKPLEDRFIADGYGVQRVPFAYNYFFIVGPAADPAGIRHMNPEEAFQKLMVMEYVSFVSRGDDSGTHTREKAIWEKAGYDYDTVRNAGSWYIETGGGMGPTLMMASEKRAYTLTDMGTYLAYRGKLELVPLVDKGDLMLNIYSAIAVNPKQVAKVNIDMANNLISFLISPDVQEIIGNYGIKKFGKSLFTPCAGTEPT